MQVWDIADRLSVDSGEMAQRRDVVRLCVDDGINSGTANTQYGHWKRATFPGASRQTGARPEVVRSTTTSEDAETQAAQPPEWRMLLKNGFSYVADWTIDAGGKLALDRSAPSEAGVYAFVIADEVVYIGTSTLLSRRMSNYRGGHVGQRTSSRINAELLKQIAAGQTVQVLFAVPGMTKWNDLPVDLASGLEAGLLGTFRPRWNKR